MFTSVTSQLIEFALQKKAKKEFKYLKNYWKVERQLERHYRINRSYRYLNRRGEIYGETPLSVLKIVGSWLLDSSTHPIYELGAGVGKSSFFLQEFSGKYVIAVERVRSFVAYADKIASSLTAKKIEFQLGDFFEVIPRVFRGYCFGSTLSDQQIYRIARELPHFSKLVTVSYALSEYSNNFRTLRVADVCFPWGRTKIFLNQKESIK